MAQVSARAKPKRKDGAVVSSERSRIISSSACVECSLRVNLLWLCGEAELHLAERCSVVIGVSRCCGFDAPEGSMDAERLLRSRRPP